MSIIVISHKLHIMFIWWSLCYQSLIFFHYNTILHFRVRWSIYTGTEMTRSYTGRSPRVDLNYYLIQAINCLIQTDDEISVRIRQNLHYMYKNHMDRKGLGSFNLFGLDKYLDYTCPDEAELPVYMFPFVDSCRISCFLCLRWAVCVWERNHL